MEISEFVVRIALLALPGVIGSKIYRKLRGRTDKKPWEDFLEILVFSIASYLLFAAIAGVCNHHPAGRASGNPETQPAAASETQPTGVSATLPTTTSTSQPTTRPSSWIDLPAFKAFYDKTEPLIWTQIFAASGIAVVLAFAMGYVHNFSLLNRLALLIRASKRTGDEDIWQTLFDSPNVEWVFVRDHKYGLVFYGFLRHYSDSGKEREVVLENVDVFMNSTGQRLYSTAAVYLSRPPHELTIEVPKIEIPREACIIDNVAKTQEQGEANNG